MNRCTGRSSGRKSLLEQSGPQPASRAAGTAPTPPEAGNLLALLHLLTDQEQSQLWWAVAVRLKHKLGKLQSQFAIVEHGRTALAGEYQTSF